MNHLERLTVHLLDKNLRRSGPGIEAQYNPTEITFSKGAQFAEVAIPGLDAPILQFIRGQSETLAVDLFFDTTEAGTSGHNVVAVTELTDRFLRMVKIDRASHAPPVVEVTWGADLPASHFDGSWASQNRSSFRCVCESVQQRFTLFSPEGAPLRATLSVRFKEYRTISQQIEEIRFESRDHTHRRVVRRGDTLAGIAAEAYDDPALWRPIAEHNGLVDPTDLPEGLELEIPPIL